MKYWVTLFLFFASPLIIYAQKNTLDYFIEEATANSPLLKDLEGQVQGLSLDSQLIRASLKPQVDGISTNSYAPVIRKFGYDNAITNGAQVSAMVQVSKDILSNKTIRERLKNLQIQGSIVGNNSKISTEDLRKVITDQYIITYGGQLQLNFTSRVTRLLQSEDTILRKLTQQNVYKQTDYLSFAVVLQQQLLNASQLTIQYTSDYMLLNYLAGIVDTLTTPLQEPKFVHSELNDFPSSIFYKQFSLDSLKTASDKLLLEANYRPKLNVFANGGYNSSLAYQPYRNFGTSIGLNLIVPIYDGRQKKLQYSKIDIQERGRQTRKDFFLRQHQQQILQLEQQLRATEKLINDVDNQIKYTETLISTSEKLLATGDIRLTDFILALNNYFSAKNLLTQNSISRLTILSQLRYWEQ